MNSFVLTNGNEAISPLLFNITKHPELKVYVVFPGQKLFVANYHPFKAYTANVFNEAVFYKINVITTVVSNLPGKKDCIPVELNLTAILKAHNEYEQW